VTHPDHYTENILPYQAMGVMETREILNHLLSISPPRHNTTDSDQSGHGFIPFALCYRRFMPFAGLNAAFQAGEWHNGAFSMENNIKCGFPGSA
jgi:hypothetical protein